MLLFSVLSFAASLLSGCRDQMGAAARAATEPRTWAGICRQLVGHYADAIALKRDEILAEGSVRAQLEGVPPLRV